jgi:cytochrome c
MLSRSAELFGTAVLEALKAFDGTHLFWERDLRLMIDGSEKDPEKGAPALVAAGMMGNRADPIFAGPDEVSGFIAQQC